MINKVFCVSILFLLLMSPSDAQDKKVKALGDNDACILIGIGVFSPSTGTGGTTFNGGIYREFVSRLLIGGELSYKKFKSRLFYWDDVDFSTFTVTTAFKYYIPGGSIQPYFGCYFNAGIHSIDENDMPGVKLVESIAASYGLGVLLGTTAKINDSFLLFLEGRYGGDWMNTTLQGYEKEIRNYGGFNALGGIMFLF